MRSVSVGGTPLWPQCEVPEEQYFTAMAGLLAAYAERQALARMVVAQAMKFIGPECPDDSCPAPGSAVNTPPVDPAVLPQS